MSRLDDLRNEINKIDKEMCTLFEERLKIVKKIGLFKKENGLNIYDEQREKQVINKNLNYLQNKENEPLYKEFIQYLMDICKKIE